VFHPQNCIYSIIADIKRQSQTQSTHESSGVIDLTANTANTADTSNTNTNAESHGGGLEGIDKVKLSTITNEWLASSELHLCTLQVHFNVYCGLH